MAHFNFKARFVAALPSVPAELDLHLGEFIQFDAATLKPLVEDDAAFLLNQGLPEDAAPFLSFKAYSSQEIANHREAFGLSETFFPIGHNGSGDVLAIDLDTREIVYFNHDANNQRVFINSSLTQFATCLCIYQEHLVRREVALCLTAIADADDRAAIQGTMWYAEVKAEVANG